MQVLVAPLENIVLGEQTSLSADEASGQLTLSVENAQGFAANDFVIIGLPGSETTEVRRIESVTADSIAITEATSFSHLKEDRIRVVRYDQRKFYRCTTEDGTYVHLSDEGSPVNIDVDKPDGTEFEDSTGVSTSWYKCTYYNSFTGIESDLADAVAVKAGDAEHYTSIYKIKDEAGFKNNSYIESDLIDRYRTEAEALSESMIAMSYQVPLASAPRIFQHIVTLYSAGLLLLKEYSLENDADTTKNGQKKIDRAEELLQKIVDGDLILLSESNTELSKQTSNRASCSNAYNSEKTDCGELFTTEDENFKMANPETGDGSTSK